MYKTLSNVPRSPQSPKTPTRTQTAFEFGRSTQLGNDPHSRQSILTYNPLARTDFLARRSVNVSRANYIRQDQLRRGLYGPIQWKGPQVAQTRCSTRSGNFQDQWTFHKKKEILGSRSFLILLTGLFCVLGGGWQLYTILDNYMHYEIISEVYFMKESPVAPPAFSICFPYVELLNWSALPPPLNEINQSFWKYELDRAIREDIEDKIQQNLKVSDVFALTPDIRSLIITGYARNPDNYKVDYNFFENSAILKYIKDDLVCYKLNHDRTVDRDKSAPPNFHSHHIAFGQERSVHLAVSINKETMDHISKTVIYVHPHSQLPRGDRDFPLNYMASNVSRVFGTSSSYIGVTYSKITLKLLKPPYSTTCYDYRESKAKLLNPEPNVTIESWYHCVHYCMWKKAESRFKEASLTSTFNQPVEIKLMSKYSLYNSSEKEQLMDEMLLSCKKSCPGQSCYQVYYVPALVTTRESYHITYLLYDMIGLETVSNFQPKMRIVELLVQILSVSGVWLGVSCVDIILPLCKLTVKTVQSRFNCINK